MPIPRRVGRAGAVAGVATAAMAGSRSLARSGAPSSSGAFPLAVSANGRYMQASGVPFLLHGYTCWSAIVALSQADAILLLDALQAWGFTAIIANAIEKRWTPSPPNNANGDPPFTATVGGQLDFTAPNSAYWAHVDWFLAQCRARGIVVWLTPAYYGYAGAIPDEGWSLALAANGSTRLTIYGAWLGARYASMDNVVWVFYGDALPDATGRALVKAIHDGIESAGAGLHPRMSHFARNSTSADDSTVPWDINAAYSAGGTVSPRVHSKVLDAYAANVGPTGCFEAQYDHRVSGTLTAQQLRKESWDNWLSGGCFNFFGDEYVWPFNTEATVTEDWKNHLNDAGISQCAFVRSFLVVRQWWELVPSTGAGLVTSGGGTVNTDGYKPRAIASDGSWGAVYVADGSSTTIDKSLLSGAFTARWYDPTNGTYVMIGTGIAASGTQAYTPPGTNAAGDTDWVWVGEVP